MCPTTPAPLERKSLYCHSHRCLASVCRIYIVRLKLAHRPKAVLGSQIRGNDRLSITFSIATGKLRALCRKFILIFSATGRVALSLAGYRVKNLGACQHSRTIPFFALSHLPVAIIDAKLLARSRWPTRSLQAPRKSWGIYHCDQLLGKQLR